jgi:ankyrin repeat protein
VKSSRPEIVSAIVDGDLARFRVLVADGAAVTEADRFGWLPIHRAAANNREEMIDLLVERGSPLEERGTDEWTPLHLACVSGSAKAVAALVRAGADVNSVAKSGNTPLHLAVMTPPATAAAAVGLTLEIVGLLLGAGADAQALNSRGRTAGDIAGERGLPAVGRLLGSGEAPGAG